MILISACLAGLNVRYNGTNSLDEKIQKLVLENKAVTVCPELMGGFSTPREPAEIVGGNGQDVLDGNATVVESSGQDVTDLYLKGAYATLQKALEVGATHVILKEYSPSCGSAKIYNGRFNGTKLAGEGVTTALLRRNNIIVLSEENFFE
ncbi:DUF523 domain-containing protein [Lysinibacillus capsici]|uniref:DUF523 domain-containing protein n=1 Tax=Lysinibacillus capsici TaxID=2115968 RepID=UPI0001DA5BBA|nr:DUF523 domain-containing protein [Lysinibacillus capsici]EFI66613.1 hypothetical protein BFZC1_20588 [Lysinibacillus fusiformis ZC1]EKU43849.1 hypothetical protein C518_1094 [Lysinibacillus fusiformis ZB2]MBU5253225.1 DUF523 domain-containing protein [Lysinibacillus capsici]MED4697699.1 DUF523 domain-containing protein [Lysinibacillus capsici]